MKKTAIAFLIIGALASCNSSVKQPDYQALFKRSYDLKDIPTAITAAQLILLNDSTNAVRDSLPKLYLAVQNFEACLQTLDAALVSKPADDELLKMKMICLEQVGKDEDLMKLAQNMFDKTGKVEYIYKVASVHLATGNFTEANKVIDVMSEKFKAGKDSVDMFIDQVRTQRVPVTAACWNMRGYYYVQTQQYQKAAEAYKKAIQTYPDFIMARRNLEQLLQNFQ
ncbi:MAG: tetratricopeptide repeat protein [Bacteroidota bacterium]|jgi:tetratricopeptide (TPR) repeat protein